MTQPKTTRETSEPVRQYRWRKFNWGLALSLAAMSGAPYLITEFQVMLYGLFNLGDLTGWLASGTASNNLLRFVAIVFVSFLAGGSINLFLGPIWKNPVALTLDEEGFDYPMLFERKLGWAEIARFEPVGPRVLRAIRVTLAEGETPFRHQNGWMDRLDKWSRKFEPHAPRVIMLSGWQVDFVRDELLERMTGLTDSTGERDAQPALPNREPRPC